MKKYYLSFLIILLAVAGNSQTNTFPTTGNTGLGLLNPAASLDIFRSYDANQTKALKMFYSGSWGYNYYATDFRFLDIASTEGGKILQLNGYGMGIGFDPPAFLSETKLCVNGNVGIGTTDTKGYKLAVAGKLIAESIKVKPQAAWPDYVFAKEYQLPSLEETEEQIKEQGHLPGIPSAMEVKENGVDLGEMNAKLLQKIEELTLHLIEMKKDYEALKNEVKCIKKRKSSKKLSHQHHRP